MVINIIWRKGQFLVHFFLIFSRRISFFVVKDTDIASYVDDSTPFIVENNIDSIIVSLEQVSDALYNLFKNNRLKNYVDKCHALVSTNKPVGIKIGDYIIDNIESEKLLGIKIDVNLNFNNQISHLCKKASTKISASARVTPFMLFSPHISTNYCPLIWMCHICSNNRKINMLHERYLRMIFNDKQSFFNGLLNKGNSASIHIRNIQRLAIKTFRFYKGLSPPLTNNIFNLTAEFPTT